MVSGWVRHSLACGTAWLRRTPLCWTSSWAAEFTTGRCRGKPIIWGMFHDKYTFERWTISHFADGGFDLDADPYEVGHDHELELVDDRSTLDQCDWPRGKSKYDARHFLRLY